MTDGRRIELRDRRIEIDGVPRLIVSGEIHYFRIGQGGWQDRLDKLKAAGGNAVASYIPWLCHEVREGEFDFAGRTRPELDLGAFIDLCRDNGLWFFARPGPFVMAELKNEGLPYRLYEQHPEIVPVTWDSKPVPSRTVDYLAPAFLEEVRRWYAAVAPVLVPRLHPTGGNVIAVQLDNEVGMLSWLTNSPDLTDLVVADFWDWLRRRYQQEELDRRYSPEQFSPSSRAAAIRSPAEEVAPRLVRALGHFMLTESVYPASRAMNEIAAAIPCDVDLFRTALERLGASPALAHGCPRNGIILTSTLTPSRERFVHLINLDGFDKPVHLTDGGRELLPGRQLVLRLRDALMLPFGVTIGDVTIVDSTAEIAAVDGNATTFRLTQAVDTITLETDRDVAPSADYDVVHQVRRWTIRARRPACGISEGRDRLTVRIV